MNGFQERIAKIREIAEEKGLEAIVLRRNPNLAWAIAGRAHVPSTLDQACFDLVISANSVTAITNVIEAPRLIAEEFPDGVEVVALAWWEGRDGQLPQGEKFGCDQPGAGRIDVGVEVEQARQILVEEDIARMRLISTQTAVALGEALREVVTEDREIDVAGRISRALWSADLDLVFIGIGGQSRVQLFRHPLPTNAPIGSRVVASICARRKGLIASTTRIATFGPLSDSEYRDYLSILEVEAAMLDATHVSAAFSQPFGAAVAAYPAHGFAADEWKNHHQGGPMGYLPRDWTAHANSTQLIGLHQVIAWNPTGKGWKGEDTVLTQEGGPEILTLDASWPSLRVAGRSRPDLLRR